MTEIAIAVLIVGALAAAAFVGRARWRRRRSVVEGDVDKTASPSRRW